MRYKYSAIIIAGLLLAGASADLQAAEAQAPRVRASVDTRTVRIGDRIALTVEAVYYGDLAVMVQSFPDDKIGDFEIEGTGLKARKGWFGKRVLTETLQLAAYNIGKLTIPQIEVKYRQKGTKDWNGVKTAAIGITVESVLASAGMASDIRDIKGPISFFELDYILIIALLALAALGVFGYVWYLKKRRAGPVRLPHETALEELEAVRSAFLKSGDVKEYYVGISDAVRRYIERAFRLKAPEMTTPEFLDSLKDSHALSTGQKDLLKEFMNACDLVKFAKYAPAKSEIDSVYTTAGKFIEETKGIFLNDKADT